MDSSDMDYIRAAIELDREFAVKTLPCLQIPKILLYWMDNAEDGRCIKSGAFNREEAMDMILTKEVVGIS